VSLSYRQMALLFVALAGLLTVCYGILFYHGTVLVNPAGMSTGGVDSITGLVIKVACAVPFVLLSAMALGFRKQLTNGAEQGLG
jgi:hypothetical protein